MEITLVDYFPRMHTAIAEWLACALYMLPLHKRFRGFRLGALMVAILGVLVVTNLVSEKVEGFLWILLMALGLVSMFLMLHIGCKTTFWESGFYWAHAFIAAEFAASLEWQINYYLYQGGIVRQKWQFYICLTAVYALVFGVLLLLNRRQERNRMHVTRTETLGVVSIALVAFFISNFNFAFQDNVFSESLGAGVLYSRTLVDFGGLVMLYAYGETRRQMNLRLELKSMESLLNRQYEQYRLFEMNNESLHRIYHDLKHQIDFIRTEKNAQKRESYLQEMEHAISMHEAEENTGNAVLDTLLTSKNLVCLQNGIVMTCYADAGNMGFMHVMDVCSIFGNAIDNAIECVCKIADEDKRLIKVTVYTQNHFLLIRIENYCESPVTFDSGLPVTTKADSQIHGYGVKSIKQAVEKYRGHLDVEQEENWFRITALIPLPEKN